MAVSPRAYATSVQRRLRRAFRQEHPPHHTGVSFSLGLFLTALPNFGVSVVILGAIAHRCSWANRLALLAAVLILNPLAKGTIYALSFAVGVALLGPVSGVSTAGFSLSAGSDVLLRLLVGNFLLAVCFAVVGYIVGLYGARTVRRYQ